MMIMMMMIMMVMLMMVIHDHGDDVDDDHYYDDYDLSKIQEQCSIRRPNLMATKMATLRAKAMAMAVAICRATWIGKSDGGKCNGNIGGKKHWQIRGGGKSTGGKLNGKIWVASKSPWQHTWQRKGNLHCGQKQ